MAWGRRCDVGCASWPDEFIYQQCPLCDESTERFSNLSPMDKEEAYPILLAAIERRRRESKLQALRERFDDYYSERCARIGVPPDGPLSVEQLAMIRSRP